MYESLTVFETLFYAAQLRLPRHMTLAQKRERVNTVITALGLDSCKDTIIGEKHRFWECNLTLRVLAAEVIVRETDLKIHSLQGSFRNTAWSQHEQNFHCVAIFTNTPCSGHRLTFCIHSAQAVSSGRASLAASASAPPLATSSSSTPPSCCWTSQPAGWTPRPRCTC